jgi:hypothetical protein
VPSIAAAAAIMGVIADITIAGIILATAGIMEAAAIVTIMVTAITATTTETILVQ